MRGRFLAVMMGLASLAFVAGCSSFPRDYAGMSSKPRASKSIAGPWEGEWVSDGGHRGGLRCLLVESACGSKSGTEAGPAILPGYEARFEARFFGIFTGHYTAMLTVNPSNDAATHLSGDHDLGTMGGGLYHYEAKVTAEQFEATYRSNADTGVFRMHRPRP